MSLNSVDSLDEFYLSQFEPTKSCLLALRDMILSQDKEIVATIKYGMPFFCFRDKMFCYLWNHKKHFKPYLGIVEGARVSDPGLITEKRSRMKILLIDPGEDLPVNRINSILQQALDLYKSGSIKTTSQA